MMSWIEFYENIFGKSLDFWENYIVIIVLFRLVGV